MFFKQNSLNSPPRLPDLECAWKVIDNTHTNRKQIIVSLRNEIQELLDLVANLKESEEKYLRSLGLVMETPLAEDGTPTRNLFTTLPDMGMNSRKESASSLVNTNFEDYSSPDKRPREHPSQQDVTIAYAEVLRVLRNEDSIARRYEHRILNANLMANIKRQELLKLIEEKESVAKNQGGTDD